MNENGPKNIKDDFNWDMFIKDPEEKRRIVSALKKEIEDSCLSPGFRAQFVNSPVDVLDFDDVNDYIAAFTKAHPELKEELDIWITLGDLKTITDIVKYCKIKNIKLNVREIVEQEELNKTLKPEEVN